jgi:hypothetical protein
MPRGAARLLAVCLAGAMALPLAVTGAARAQPGGLARGLGTGNTF